MAVHKRQPWPDTYRERAIVGKRIPVADVRIYRVGVFDGARGVAVCRVEGFEIVARHHAVYPHVAEAFEGVHVGVFNFVGEIVLVV